MVVIPWVSRGGGGGQPLGNSDDCSNCRVTLAILFHVLQQAELHIEVGVHDFSTANLGACERLGLMSEFSAGSSKQKQLTSNAELPSGSGSTSSPRSPATNHQPGPILPDSI